MKIEIHPDIRRASTLPSAVYHDPEVYRRALETLFPRTWHVAGETGAVPEPGRAAPAVLLEGCMDEPLVLTRDRAGALHCLSNVCTHRGNIVVAEACAAQSLRCRYHGRRFGLDGRFSFMPEFDGAEGFPSASDDLPRVPFATWGPLVFASLSPEQSFEDLTAPIRSRLEVVPWERLVHDPATSRDYVVEANWALYCDNYLEGFHIPFVHAALAEALEYGAYATETFERGSIQIGIAKEGEDLLDLPADHPDHGRRVAAYYVWLFPATMINVYPWGISVNAVRPLGPMRTRVSFLSFVADASRRKGGAGGDLHRVELEDEEVVQGVQRGVRSRLYDRGRYSPTREIGVHHFHRLLAGWLSG